MTSFGDAFLEDYFAECDEHLTSIRQALLTLDRSVGASPDDVVVEQLFRGYHSLKGLAGMVEDRRGELLAHEMESYLRAIRDGDAALTTLGVERLIDGTRALGPVAPGAQVISRLLARFQVVKDRKNRRPAARHQGMEGARPAQRALDFRYLRVCDEDHFFEIVPCH
jgi:chemotaxis protein histidine kinase CheA